MTAEERRARRAEWPVRVVSSVDASVTAEAMAEADLELYRAMTGAERLRILTALVNLEGVRGRLTRGIYAGSCPTEAGACQSISVPTSCITR